MSFTVEQANAVNNVIGYLGQLNRYTTGQPPTYDAYRDGLALLAGHAYKAIQTGVTPDQTRALLASVAQPHQDAHADQHERPDVIYPNPNLDILANRVKAARSHNIGTIDIAIDTLTHLLDLVATPASQR